MVETAEMFQAIRHKYNSHEDKPLPVRLTRWYKHTLFKAFGICGFTRGAELGTREGLGALALCEAMPGLRLLCVDPWDVWPGHKDMNRYKDEPVRFLEEARERLAGYDVEFVRARSQDWAQNIEDESLDFVYIDGDHSFDGTMLDLILWVPKVRKGGIVSGHEFKCYGYNGVIPAVRVYTYAHLVREWYITNDKEPSWFWMRA